jgi:hypothetical protein
MQGQLKQTKMDSWMRTKTNTDQYHRNTTQNTHSRENLSSNFERDLNDTIVSNTKTHNTETPMIVSETVQPINNKDNNDDKSTITNSTPEHTVNSKTDD